MLFKNIMYWKYNDWKPSNIKTDSLKIETKNYIINIVDDRDCKKVEIGSKVNKDKDGRPLRTFTAFID